MFVFFQHKCKEQCMVCQLHCWFKYCASVFWAQALESTKTWDGSGVARTGVCRAESPANRKFLECHIRFGAYWHILVAILESCICQLLFHFWYTDHSLSSSCRRNELQVTNLTFYLIWSTVNGGEFAQFTLVLYTSLRGNWKRLIQYPCVRNMICCQ